MLFDPNDEGITHINIYSKSNTNLGKMLSNWYRQHMQLSIGEFWSIEGLIFFLGSFDEKLRELSGFEAKHQGNQLDRDIRLPEDIFKGFIKEAMHEKLYDNYKFKKELMESHLPLTHYYRYGNKVIEITKWQWQVEEWNKLRKAIQL